MHPHSPLCPNCSRPMVVARTILGLFDEPEVNVFKCSGCRGDFHNGRPLNNLRNRRAIMHDPAVNSDSGMLTYREEP